MTLIRTDRLNIRPLHHDDRSGFCTILSDPLVSSTLRTRLPGSNRLQLIAALGKAKLITLFERNLSERINGVQSRFAVTLKDNGRFIGSIGSYSIDGQRIGLSYWISSACHGEGLGSEALRGYCLPALRVFGARYILANVAGDNPASIKAAWRAGFRPSRFTDDPGFGAVEGRVLLEIDRKPAAYIPIHNRRH